MQVAEKDPRHWLRYRAPSEPGLPGWTERVPDESDPGAPAIYQPTPEELAETFRVLVESGEADDILGELRAALVAY